MSEAGTQQKQTEFKKRAIFASIVRLIIILLSESYYWVIYYDDGDNVLSLSFHSHQKLFRNIFDAQQVHRFEFREISPFDDCA